MSRGRWREVVVVGNHYLCLLLLVDKDSPHEAREHWSGE